MKLFKRRKLNQRGFGHIEAVLAILVIAGIAATGVRIMSGSHAATPNSIATQNKAPTLINDQPPDIAYKSKGALVQAKTVYCQSVTICFYYADMSEGGVTNTGASVSITQADPTLGLKDGHSLAELAVGDYNYNYVEVGWVVDRGLNGDSLPHLFVFHWVNQVPSNCYNGCGFVTLPGSYSVGQALKVGPKGLFSIKYTNNEWLVSYDNQRIGYFPESIWSGNFTSSDTVQAFGEVASDSSTKPETQMGNGILGTKPGSAILSNLTLLNPTSASTLAYNSLGPPKYGFGGNVASCQSSCSMTFGGPGYTQSANPYVNFPTPASTGLTLSINGAGIADADVAVKSFSVNWGDGTSTTLPGISGTVSGSYAVPVTFQSVHNYSSAGIYTITVNAIDANNNSGTGIEKVTLK